ncbi:hypothetical protein MMC20_000282 [Loxospora ochrophaea]|nr:hypothetical protein [Loxospora ochrophaea]
MANLAQHLPVEIILEILKHVEAPYIYNATSICREWWDAGCDIRKGTILGNSRRDSLRDSESVLRTTWRSHYSHFLSWAEAGRHVAHLNLASREDLGSKDSNLFTSTDGHIILQATTSRGKSWNKLYSTDDLTSYMQIWAKRRFQYQHRRQEIAERRNEAEYPGHEVIAEDLRPSFLLALPTSAPVIDASFEQYNVPRTTISNVHAEMYEELKSSIAHGNFQRRIDFALLLASRQVLIVSAVLERKRSVSRFLDTILAKTWESLKPPIERLEQSGWSTKTYSRRDIREYITQADHYRYRWLIKSSGTISDVCKASDDPSVVSLNTDRAIVIIGCSKGIEVAFVPFDCGWPGDHAKGAARRWIDTTDNVHWRCLSLTVLRSGVVALSMRPAEGDSVNQKNPEQTFAILDSPLKWPLRSPHLGINIHHHKPPNIPFTWNDSILPISKNISHVTPVVDCDRHFVAWDSTEETVCCLFFPRFPKVHHDRPMCQAIRVAQLKPIPFHNTPIQPSALAATHCRRSRSNYILACSYPVSSSSSSSVTEEIYLGELNDFRDRDSPHFNLKETTLVTPQYLTKVSSYQGIAFLRLGAFPSIKRSYDSWHNSPMDVVILVIGFKGNSEKVICWYLVKGLEVDWKCARKEVWRVNGDKTGELERDGGYTPKLVPRYNYYASW